MPDRAFLALDLGQPRAQTGPGGATRTLRHGQGFDQGAVADHPGWELIRAPVRASTRGTRTARPRALRALFVALEEWVKNRHRAAVKSRSVDCTRHGGCG